MAKHMKPSNIYNKLVTSKQVIEFQQQRELTDSKLLKVFLLTQSAGILLRLPQEVIATALILLQRHLVSPPFTTTPSLLSELEPDASLTLASAASIYLSAKQSFYPLSPRSIINIYALLTSTQSSPLTFINSASVPVSANPDTSDIAKYYISEGTYQTRRLALFDHEFRILTSLSFDTKVALPYTLALTYLSTLNVATTTLSQQVLAHLNAALLSPQLLYLTHQPNALAVAAIYISAREQGLVLVDQEVAWWEVFDVGREELGFLVLSMSSLNQFVESEKI